MEETNYYFIALIPPEAIRREITGFKEDFARRFNSKAALKVVPHITLKAPFRLPVEEHEGLLRWFRALRTGIAPFPVELRNFGSFHNRHHSVIYVQPVLGTPLRSLQATIIRQFREAYPEQEIEETEVQFKPHMTIAYRDLEAAMFTKAWEQYKTKEYRAVFEAVGLHLLQHDGNAWQVSEIVPLR